MNFRLSLITFLLLLTVPVSAVTAMVDDPGAAESPATAQRQSQALLGDEDGPPGYHGDEAMEEDLGEDDLAEDDPTAEEEIREENEWAQKQSEKIAVSEAVIAKPWNPVPFQTRFFDYSYEEIEQSWPRFMRALLIPFPSPEYLQRRIERFPELRAELWLELGRLRREQLHRPGAAAHAFREALAVHGEE